MKESLKAKLERLERLVRPEKPVLVAYVNDWLRPPRTHPDEPVVKSYQELGGRVLVVRYVADWRPTAPEFVGDGSTDEKLTSHNQ